MSSGINGATTRWSPDFIELDERRRTGDYDANLRLKAAYL